jgi:murein L,D-transpeptidase YafK
MGAFTSASLVAHASRPRSVEDVVKQLKPRLRPQLVERFKEAHAAYPPARLTLIAYKQEKRLEVWAPGRNAWVRVRSYTVLAASGEDGPKLRQGDYQVPEGVYPLTGLNPNSKYHLSIRVGYPNANDLAWASREGRSDLGGDIYIHGKDVSRGCIAIGDERIEELFTLVAETGVANAKVIIAPNRRLRDLPKSPVWVDELYGDVRRALEDVRGD